MIHISMAFNFCQEFVCHLHICNIFDTMSDEVQTSFETDHF